MTDFSDRVVAAREAAGLTQAELAEAIGMTQQGVAAIENGKSDRPKKLRELARVLGVSEDHLLGEEPSAPYQRTKGQRILHVPADQIVASGGAKLLVYSGAAAGKGKLIVGSDIVDRVEMPAVLKDVQGAYGLMIDGSSMEPEFWPGDIAWVHPHLRPMRGKNHILYHTPPFGDDAEAIIKRVNGWNDREWDLEQWNPARKFKEFRQEWPICHRVVGKYDAA